MPVFQTAQSPRLVVVHMHGIQLSAVYVEWCFTMQVVSLQDNGIMLRSGTVIFDINTMFFHKSA